MRRLFLLVLTLAFCSPFIHAQAFSVYFTSSNTHFSNVVNGDNYSPTTTTYSNLFTDYWPPEFGGGVSINPIHRRFIKLGMDFRGSTRHGVGGADTAMAGPRLAIRLPFHIQPYVSAEGGYVATRTAGTVVTTTTPVVTTSTSTVITNQYAAWEVFGGIDVPIIPHLDFRAVEIGGGKGYLANSGIQNITFNNTNTQISLLSIDTGIVVHF
jgi:hypothetical protein